MAETNSTTQNYADVLYKALEKRYLAK